jgi:hypothetical protein
MEIKGAFNMPFEEAVKFFKTRLNYRQRVIPMFGKRNTVMRLWWLVLKVMRW